MRNLGRAVLAIVLAAATLAVAVGVAGANRIELSNQAIRTVWREFRVSGGGFEITCPVTMEGSFHSRTISKVTEQLIGFITSAQAAGPGCTGGAVIYVLNGREILRVTVSNTLPWHIQYESFTGTLPNITGMKVRLVDVSLLVQITIEEARCLYRSTAERPLLGTVRVGGGGVISAFSFERASIPLKEGLFCPAATISGNGTVTLLGTTTAISVRLVS
jgi:hypothetical protein